MLPKSLTPLLILKILHTNSSFESPLTQEKIADKLEQYGIVLERKAIGRAIAALVDADYPIERTSKGFYLESLLIEDAKLQIVVDSVLSNRSLSAQHCKELVDELSAFGSPAFRSRMHNYLAMSTWSKPEKDTVRYNIAAIDDAIAMGKQIAFDHRRKDTVEHVTASPVKVFMHHDHYYMVGVINHDRRPISTLYNFRLDNITAVRVLTDSAVPPTAVKGFEKGFDLQAYLAAHPILLEDHRSAKAVRFLFSPTVKDELVEVFGDKLSIQPGFAPKSAGLTVSVGLSTATVHVAAEEMIQFALRYPTSVFILSPESLRTQVKQRLRNGLMAYEEFESEQNL